MPSEITVSRIVLPGHVADERVCKIGTSIEDFVVSSGWATWREETGWDFRLPTVCARNGLPVLRRDWPLTVIEASDRIVFFARPMGGNGRASGKALAGIVGAIALSAFAPWAGGVVAGALFGGNVLAAGVIGAGIPVMGSMAQFRWD